MNTNLIFQTHIEMSIGNTINTRDLSPLSSDCGLSQILTNGDYGRKEISHWATKIHWRLGKNLVKNNCQKTVADSVVPIV
jgi:hypothetical protein